MTKPNTKVSELELSVRSMGMLQQLEVETVSDIADLSAEQVLAHPHGNKLVVRELEAVLEEAELEWRK